jgi:hypothetical protein
VFIRRGVAAQHHHVAPERLRAQPGQPAQPATAVHHHHQRAGAGRHRAGRVVRTGQVDAVVPGRGQQGAAAGQHRIVRDPGGELVVQADVDREPSQPAVQADRVVQDDRRFHGTDASPVSGQDPAAIPIAEYGYRSPISGYTVLRTVRENARRFGG